MTINIHGKEYVTVAERVQAFWERYKGNGYIDTKLILADETRVVMRARCGVYDGENVRVMIGSGHAEEMRGSSKINTTSALENCETSAIGRALASAGFGIEQSYASANEVQIAISQQNADLPPEQVVLGFGKYKGETLGCVLEQYNDAGYLLWLAQNSTDDFVREAAREMMADDPVDNSMRSAQDG
jgi:hypothetical protein